ncbi:hypothetical protein Hanom_Chr11g01018521 [Helianthus anomalus]
MLIGNVQKLKKQTVFFLKTVEVWSTSSAVYICGAQTADILPLKKQTSPKISCVFVGIVT